MTHQEKIRALREDNDLTQEQVAKVLNVEQVTYSQYERGQRGIKIEQLKALCLYYGVSADYIIGLPKDLDYPER